MKAICKLIYRELSSAQNRRRFIYISGVILVVTGFAKLFTLTGDTTLLAVRDPIFGAEFRHLMFAVGFVELLIAGGCFFGKRDWVTVMMIVSISSGFLAYRVGIYLIDWQRPCGCLGNLTDVLGISPPAGDWIAGGLLGFLLMGSYVSLFCASLQGEPSFKT